MGTTFQNVTVRGPDRDAVVEQLRSYGERGYVAPTSNSFTVVFPSRGSGWNQPEAAADLALSLAHDLSGVALVSGVFDDDLLALQLYESGGLAFEYLSSERRCLNLQRFCEVLGRPAARVPALFLLKVPRPLPLLFESFRHLYLARLLRLPEWACFNDYESIQANLDGAGEFELPGGLNASALQRT